MLRTALIALLALLLVAPAAPAQSTRNKILRECQSGRLTGDYTAREIRDARNNIPDDLDQYTDCRDVLSRALLSRAGGAEGSGGDPGSGAATGGSGGSGGGSAAPLTPTTEADQQALQGAAQAGSTPIQIAGRPVTPGESALRNDLPVTLLVLLALLAVAALAALAPGARRGLPALAAIRRRVLPGRSG
jgi:hypothetical protein